MFGLRRNGATALPSGVAMASTWNPDLIRRGGAIIGAEARANGFNVLLAGGANLMRDPRNGRTFEYLSEDPLLTGVLAGSAIAGDSAEVPHRHEQHAGQQRHHQEPAFRQVPPDDPEHSEDHQQPRLRDHQRVGEQLAPGASSRC